MMRTANSLKVKSLSLINKLPSSLFYLLSPIALLCLCFYPFFTSSPPYRLPHFFTIATNHSSIFASISPEKAKAYEKPCDFSNGEWVRDREGPLYNGATCRKIKKTQNCIINGRPDPGYLFWRWKPRECYLSRFEPNTFLQLIKNKHVAFVGDSLARNQLQSLFCMLATVSTPKSVYNKGSNRWHFPSLNANLSFYWSPFLVEGAQRKNTGPHYNKINLGSVNIRWARDMDEMNLIVLSVGHWFSVPSVYYEGDKVIGCLNCPDLNYTDIGFHGPLRKALRTTLNSIIERKAAKGNGIDVIVRTFSPSHFEGDWDKGGTCAKTEPYGNGEKQLKGEDAEIRRIEIEEVENAKTKAKQFVMFRLEVLDITKLALLRPDGHPGAYMNYFPFANGIPEYVQNDCVHWCLPGPVDTWNEIFLEIMKKWDQQRRTQQ